MIAKPQGPPVLQKYPPAKYPKILRFRLIQYEHFNRSQNFDEHPRRLFGRASRRSTPQTFFVHELVQF